MTFTKLSWAIHFLVSSVLQSNKHERLLLVNRVGAYFAIVIRRPTKPKVDDDADAANTSRR